MPNLWNGSYDLEIAVALSQSLFHFKQDFYSSLGYNVTTDYTS